MDDEAVYFVAEPPVATIEGGNVYVEVRSGGRKFRFEGPVSVFLQTFAHFGQVARQWRVGGAEIIPLHEVPAEHA